MTSSGLFGCAKPGASNGQVDFEIIGVPSDMGHSYVSGTRHGPAAIRSASQSVKLTASGVDHGDIGHAYEQDWHNVLNEVEHAASDIFARGSYLVTLGGDHAISYAAVAGAATFNPLNIVWFDAHTDFCRWQPAEWHNHKQVLRRIAGLPHVGQMIQIGHRGITYFDEVERFDQIHVIRSVDAAKSINTVLAALPENEPVYMSIDIDAIDPRWAPGTGHPVPGGLSVAVLSKLAQSISSVRNVIGVDLMEVNPVLDHNDITTTAAVSILASVLPNLKRWQANYLEPANTDHNHQKTGRVS